MKTKYTVTFGVIVDSEDDEKEIIRCLNRVVVPTHTSVGSYGSGRPYTRIEFDKDFKPIIEAVK